MCSYWAQMDMDSKRVVSKARAEQFAGDVGALLCETSAKENWGVNELFAQVGDVYPQCNSVVVVLSKGSPAQTAKCVVGEYDVQGVLCLGIYLCPSDEVTVPFRRQPLCATHATCLVCHVFAATLIFGGREYQYISLHCSCCNSMLCPIYDRSSCRQVPRAKIAGIVIEMIRKFWLVLLQSCVQPATATCSVPGSSYCSS